MTFNRKEEREKVIIDNMYIVNSIATRYAEETGIDIQDLEGYGYEGLIVGIDRYDNSKKEYLSTYLHKTVNSYIKKGVNFINNYYNFTPESLQQHKENLVYSENTITKSIEYEEWTHLLYNVIKNTLMEKEEIILNKYYGLKHELPRTFEQIGKEQGYSDQNAQRIHTRALCKLKLQVARNLKYFHEVNHDIDAEVGYTKKKRRK